MQADKTGYNYEDMANIAVDIIGAGTYAPSGFKMKIKGDKIKGTGGKAEMPLS